MNELANKLLQYLNSAEGFIKEQAPDFAAQFIAYEQWQVKWWFSFWVILSSILVIWQIAVFSMHVAFKRERPDLVMLMAMIGAAGAISLFCTADYFCDLKKMEIAPKVYMVERAKNLLMKGTK